jgi:hypothetical protein
VYVLSARLSLELSECNVCLSYGVILEWIKLYKVHRKPWGLSGSPAIVFDPPAWCGAARTLCAGDVETPFLWGRSSLVEAASRWPRKLGECLHGEPLW